MTTKSLADFHRELSRYKNAPPDPDNADQPEKHLAEALPETDVSAALDMEMPAMEPDKQGLVVYVLAKNGHAEARSWAEELIGDREELIAFDAAAALAWLGHDEGFAKLAELAELGSARPPVERSWIVECLEGLDDPRADRLRRLIAENP